jgi:hypothetical protein
MTRRSRTGFAAVIVACAVGALLPVGAAIAHRTEGSAHAIKPAGVQADVIVTVRGTALNVAPADLAAGKTIFYVVNKSGSDQSFSIDGPGLAKPRTLKVGSGRGMTLTVRLKQGSYKLLVATGRTAHSSRVITVRKASLAPPDNGSTNKPPDNWWDQCQNI